MAQRDYDYDELFPGRFLKAVEFKGRDVTLKVASVEIEEMPDKKGTKKNADGVLVKVKCIMYFEGKPNGEAIKGMVVNKTNGECIKGMFGRKTSAWIGRRITFYPQDVEAFGAVTPAIRVRGSPDLAGDKQVELNLGQNKRTVTMRRTGQQAAGKPAPPRLQAAPQPQEPEDRQPPPPEDDPEPPPDLPEEPPLFNDEQRA